jgi:hypothetical protein
MQDTKITNGNSLSNEVTINLNVLCTLMLNWIGGHVDCVDVVTIHQRGASEGRVQLDEKLSQPGGFCNSISYYAILGLSTGS